MPSLPDAAAPTDPDAAAPTDPAASSLVATTPGLAVRVLLAPSVPDWIIATYVFAFAAALALATPSPVRNRELLYLIAVGVAYVGAVLLFRLRLDRRAAGLPMPRAALAGYRLLAFVTIMAVFFRLRAILPIVAPGNMDAELYQLDLLLFGVEPTLALEPWSTPLVVGWFAFYYGLYFFILAGFVFTSLLGGRDERRMTELIAGLGLVTGIGQLLYMLVPGFGPVAHLAADFAGPLDGGMAHELVVRLAATAGPQKDVFPSLHTAVPTFLALFCFRHHRRLAPWMTFFAVNIACATVVLRWHWAVDVVAGLALAVIGHRLAPHLVLAWQRLRERHRVHTSVIW